MSEHTPPGGPYCDNDLEFWWVAVEDCGYLEARRLVKGTATVDDWQRLEYLGKSKAVHLWDGDEHDRYPEDPPCRPEMECRETDAWAFQVVDR